MKRPLSGNIDLKRIFVGVVMGLFLCNIFVYVLILFDNKSLWWKKESISSEHINNNLSKIYNIELESDEELK